MNPIVRMFENKEQALAAAHALNEEGFPKSALQVISTPTEGEKAPSELAGEALLAGYKLGTNTKLVSAESAEALAEGLARGQTVLICKAAFGYSELAKSIMGTFGPVGTDRLEPAKEPPVDWDEGAPVSSALRIPVLIKNKPELLSDFIGVPALSHGRTWLSKAFGEHAPNFRFSNLIGMKLLSGNATPLSSLIGMKPLSAPKPGRTTSFGMPLLSAKKTPLSSMLGLRTLSKKEPRSKTHSFGLPLLTRD